MDDDLVKDLHDAGRVVAHPMCFKASLGIGIKAYASLTWKDRLPEVWGVVGAALRGASLAKNPWVVATFFGRTGLLGTPLFAATPVGWVIVAAVAIGGAYYGVMRLAKSLGEKWESSCVDVIPKFINTPLDVLAVGLCDLMMPLALKIAVADGEIAKKEREALKGYFVDEWGYDLHYIDAAMKLFERHLDEYTIEQLTEGLRSFTKENKDCNHRKVQERFIKLLHEIAYADGEIHEKEEERIQEISKNLSEDPWHQKIKVRLPSLKKRVRGLFGRVPEPKVKPSKIRLWFSELKEGVLGWIRRVPEPKMEPSKLRQKSLRSLKPRVKPPSPRQKDLPPPKSNVQRSGYRRKDQRPLKPKAQPSSLRRKDQRPLRPKAKPSSLHRKDLRPLRPKVKPPTFRPKNLHPPKPSVGRSSCCRWMGQRLLNLKAKLQSFCRKGHPA